MTLGRLHLPEGGPVDHLLVIGAGDGADLRDWLALGAARLTLVEPAPAKLAALGPRIAGHDDVDLLACAVAEPDGPRDLALYDVPGLDALRPPTGLYELYPGLVPSGEVTVPARTAPALVAGLALDPAARHVLVLRAPGEEMAILQALARSGDLALFETIVVRTGRRPLYHGAAGVETILDWLIAADYAAHRQRDDSRPDHPVLMVSRADGRAALIAERDAADLARRTAENDAAEARARAAMLEADLTDLQAKYAALRTDRDAQEALLHEIGAVLAQIAETDDA